MTALGIRYLTGYSVAADVTEERKPEWPPHPARVFMAMAAAHFETGANIPELEALQWLEQQAPPQICASEEHSRTPVEAYVPVNDEAGYGSTRSRQPRAFPTCRPDRDTVWLVYPSRLPESLTAPLSSLCSKVTRIGHSSSLVQMWIAEKPDETPNWVPSKQGELRLRVAEEGLLDSLVKSFNEAQIAGYWTLREKLEEATGKEAKQLKDQFRKRFGSAIPQATRPQISSWAGYAKASSAEQALPVLQGPFSSQLLVLERELETSSLGLESTLQLTRALRNAILSVHSKDCPPWFSGHEANGDRTLQSHLAFIPLPFVGDTYGDGHLLGAAIAVPNGISLPEIQKYLGPALYEKDGTLRTITLWEDGSVPWQWRLRLSTESSAKTLRAESYTRQSNYWASITPVVLHHFPDKRKPADVERILREGFRTAGLPEPLELRIRSASFFKGAPHATQMPKLEQKGTSLSNYQTHVMVRFATPIRGPILLGRGRFRGYGLMRPIGSKEWKTWN